MGKLLVVMGICGILLLVVYGLEIECLYDFVTGTAAILIAIFMIVLASESKNTGGWTTCPYCEGRGGSGGVDIAIGLGLDGLVPAYRRDNSVCPYCHGQGGYYLN